MSYVGAKPYLIKDGGTGQTSLPTDGQLLIGNTATSGFNLANLTAGSGISVTNGNGTIQIASTVAPPVLTPVFLARLTSTQTAVTGDGTDYTPIIFDTLDGNVGFAYDNTTGIFTAPTTQEYVFTFGITPMNIDASHTVANFRLETSTGRIAYGFYGNPFPSSYSGTLMMSQTVIISMAANETAQVSLLIDNGTKTIDVYGDNSGNYNTWFAGYLLAGNNGSTSNLDAVVDGSGNTVTPTGGLITLVDGTSVSSLSQSASHITFDVANCTQYALQVGNAAGSLASLPLGSVNKPLISGGAGVNPAFGTLSVAGGGTGATSFTAHSVLLGEGTSAVSSVGPGSTDLPLIGQGAGSDPIFSVLNPAGGGTGTTGTLTGVVTANGSSAMTASAVTQHDVLVGGASNAIVSVSPSTAGYVLTSNGVSADPSFQAPTASGLSTLTDGMSNIVSPTAGNITFVNGNNISNLSSVASQITFSVTGTTNHLVQLGNSSGSLSSLSPGTSGQVLISGGAGSDPAFGVAGVPAGGTGLGTLTAHAVLLGEGTSNVGFAGPAAANLPLVSNGVSADPAFAVLTVPGGGTGVTSLTNNAVILGQGTSALSSVGPGASGLPLVAQGASAPIFTALGVPGGGTGATTLTGILTGNGTSPVTASAVSQYTTLVAGAGNAVSGIGPGTATQVLTSNGAGANPSYQSLGSIGATLTLSDDVNTSITPSAGNIQLVGHVNEQGATKFSTVTAGSNIANINPMSSARWIVDGLGFNGTHTTITSAIAAATAGDTILILPGIYTENFTLKAGITLQGLGAMSAKDANSVVIVGKITFNASTPSIITGLTLETNSDYLWESTSGSNDFYINNCYLKCSNHTGVNLATNMALRIESCIINVLTTGISYFSVSAGGITVRNSSCANFGLSVTPISLTGGSISLINTNPFQNTIAASGSSAVYADFSQIANGNNTLIALTGTASCVLYGCDLQSGTASTVTVGTGCTAYVVNNVINTSNTNAFTGAGIIYSGGNEYLNVNSNTVTTKNATSTDLVYTPSGITFDNSNILKNYVQGTWTPGISFGGATTGITYTSQQGQYTRIGNVLYFSCLITLLSKGSATGAAAITGFPYVPNFALAQNTSHISSISNFTLGSGYQNIFLDTSGVVTTTIPMVKVGSTVNYTPMSNTEFANNSRLEFNAFYFL